MPRRNARLITIALAIIALTFVAALFVFLRQRKEAALRQDVLAMRAAISQYTLDNLKRPQSLYDLVKAGYFREVPEDPTTGKKSTWVLEWSKEPRTPGIINIHPGAPAYRNW